MEYEYILFDRIEKIKQIINKYGIDNFYISYSGGKDSNVLSFMIDQAIPSNNIQRVYCNTGIELKSVSDFVINKSLCDDRFIIIHPHKNIKDTLEKVGYPFKSKLHSTQVERYQNKGYNDRYVKVYLGKELTIDGKVGSALCPKCLEYQFNDDYKIKISSKCCDELKKKPLNEWSKCNNKKYRIIGIRRAEKGFRTNADCLVFQKDKLKSFQPLVPIDDNFIEWYINKYKIQLPSVYYPPYNFKRTGCKGCPYNINLQKELDTLFKYFPNEYYQCENIWKVIYNDYRIHNYRLDQYQQLSLF